MDTSVSSTGKFFPAFLQAILITGVPWISFGLQWLGGSDWNAYGLEPRTGSGLLGILTMPFLHGNFEHLVSNTPALFVMALLIGWGYPRTFWRVTLFVMLLGGFWTWIIGRPSYHIGASGLLYGYFGFLFLAGILSSNFRMLGISFLVIFLYGGLIWGIFPIEEQVSWEAHAAGLSAGVTAAFVFKAWLPLRKKFEWEEEDEEDDESEYPTEIPYWEQTRIENIMKTPQHWEIQTDGLYRKFEFTDFRTAWAFMSQVAGIAEAHQHHPDWRNSYAVVEIWLRTHEAYGRVTEKDHAMALEINRLVS